MMVYNSLIRTKWTIATKHVSCDTEAVYKQPWQFTLPHNIPSSFVVVLDTFERGAVEEVVAAGAAELVSEPTDATNIVRLNVYFKLQTSHWYYL